MEEFCPAFAAAALMLFVFGLAVGAQDLDDVTIGGKVTDANGLAVVGATVTVTSVDRGEVRTVVTNEEGQYRIVKLKPGTYKIKVTASRLWHSGNAPDRYYFGAACRAGFQAVTPRMSRPRPPLPSPRTTRRLSIRPAPSSAVPSRNVRSKRSQTIPETPSIWSSHLAEHPRSSYRRTALPTTGFRTPGTRPSSRVISRSRAVRHTPTTSLSTASIITTTGRRVTAFSRRWRASPRSR